MLWKAQEEQKGREKFNKVERSFNITTKASKNAQLCLKHEHIHSKAYNRNEEKKILNSIPFNFLERWREAKSTITLNIFSEKLVRSSINIAHLSSQ